MIMLRRTQATTVEVNSKAMRIGDTIPTYRMCTIELDWGSQAEFLAYRRIYREAVKWLYTGDRRDDGGVAAGAPQMSKQYRTVGNVGMRSFAISCRERPSSSSPSVWSSSKTGERVFVRLTLKAPGY